MTERSEQGLKTAARFALQPNMWGFCGEDSSQNILREFVSDKNDEESLVRETLSEHGFPHLNAFLEAISELSGIDAYDNEVVMSYWLGGDLTEKVGPITKEVLIDKYGEKISETFAEQLKQRLPENIFLTHLSQVSLIAASDYDPIRRMEMINHCMIAGGTVVEIDKEKRLALVNREFVTTKDGQMGLTEKKIKVKIDPDLTPELKAGDSVAIHLGFVAGQLTPDQIRNLQYWNQKVLEII